MAIYNLGQMGTWIDMRTGMGYSGLKRTQYDVPADPKTGKPIIQFQQTTQTPIKTSVIKPTPITKPSPIIQPTKPRVGAFDVLKQLPSAMEETIREGKLIPQPIREPLRKITEFFQPKNEEEAKRMGLINIGTKEKPTYFDVVGMIGGMKKVGPIAAKITGAERVAMESKVLQKVERKFITSVKETLPQLKVAGQYLPRSTDKLATMAKNLVKSDIITAEKMALEGTDDKAVATAVELIKHYSDEGIKATKKLTKESFFDKAADIANTTATKLTELGRSVQAAYILSRLTPEGQVRFAARQIQKFNETATLGKRIQELTGKQAEYIITEMRVIDGIADITAKSMRFQKLQNYISDLVPSPLIAKIISVWKAGLLTGIKTSGVNIFANVSHFGTETIKEVPATLVDSVVSLFTKKRTVALPDIQTIKQTIEGIKEGFEKGTRYLTTGYDERNIGAKLDWKKVSFGTSKIAKGIQRYEETVFRILGTEDQPFYYGAKALSLKNQATAQAINKGLKGLAKQKFIESIVNSPTDEMLRYALLDAETAVFQNPTALGRAAKKIQEIGGGLGELIVPFGRTPSAVASQIINYSPIGIIKTIVQNIGKGNFNQRLFAQGIGRGITGIGGLWLGSELFKKGLVALDRPINEREQKLWELEGKQANSVKVGDKWRTIQVLGPVGNLILVGAHFKNEFSKSGSPTEAFMNAIGGSAKSFTEQTFLKGMNQFVDFITDPARSAIGYLGSVIGSTIPTLVSDIARATDITERRAETLLERVKTRIPGLRQTLEPQIDVLGKERKISGNILEIMVDPTRPSKEKTTPIISEFRRLFDLGYKVSPTLLGDKKGYESLTQEQNTDLWKRVGEVLEEKLNSLILDDRYLKSSDENKSKLIDDFVGKAKAIARTEKVLELTQGLQGEELKKKLSELKKSGLLTIEVFNLYLLIR